MLLLVTIICCIGHAAAVEELDASFAQDEDDTMDNNNQNQNAQPPSASSSTTTTTTNNQNHHRRGPAPLNSPYYNDVRVGQNPRFHNYISDTKNRPTFAPVKPKGSEDGTTKTNPNDNSGGSSPTSSAENLITKYRDPLAQVIDHLNKLEKDQKTMEEEDHAKAKSNEDDDEEEVQAQKLRVSKALDYLVFYTNHPNILAEHRKAEYTASDNRWELDKDKTKYERDSERRVREEQHRNKLDELMEQYKAEDEEIIRNKKVGNIEEEKQMEIELMSVMNNMNMNNRQIRTDTETEQQQQQPQQQKEQLEQQKEQLQEKVYEEKERIYNTEKQQQQQQDQPSSQPTSSSNSPTIINSIYTYEQTYNSIFQNQMEEYDLLKFDPYSLSGAPIGGWGRATRRRLASLPLRLVSDLDNSGMNLWYSDSDTDENEINEEVGVEGEVADGGEGVKEDESKENDEKDEEKDEDVKEGGGQTGDSSYTEHDALSKSTSAAATTKGIKRSSGPHFTIHDSTGQKYICRVYAEDELIVLSRLDSAFHPAITIWDDAKYKINVADDEKSTGNDNAADLYALNDMSEGNIKKKFQFSINSGGVNGEGDNMGNLPEGIRSSVAKMLRKMGMNDAAVALEGQNNNQLGLDGDIANVEVDVIVADIGIGVDGGVDEQELADIIKAAAVGAGINTVDTDDMKGAETPDMKQRQPKPLLMNKREIYNLLQNLKGLCSQLHGGWWSYEWCHQEQIRQFHVAMSHNDPSRPQYDIQDVTLVGKYGGKMHIIYPEGTYPNGAHSNGITSTIQYDNKGKALKTTTRAHTKGESAMYAAPFTIEPAIKHQGKPITLPNQRGPIISQTFEGGGFCEEVGRPRRMEVELRCCTKNEITYWLDSRKTEKEKAQSKKEEMPSAVLVSVKEEDTCDYRSRVCTPLLCELNAAAKPDITKPNIKKTNDSLGNLLSAIFGDEIVQQGEIQVYFPDDNVGNEFDELIHHAENGGDFTLHPAFQRVKEALEKGNGINSKKLIKDLLTGDDISVTGGIGNAGSVVIPGSIEVTSESIREILDKVLLKRPCLMKNLGWWTYEFCHTKQIRQYHANNLIDQSTGIARQKIETEHILGVYKGSGNSIEDYPNEEEHLHVVNVTGSDADLMTGKKRKTTRAAQNAAGKKGGQPGGNGAVYEQEYKLGEICDHEDVAEAVIKGGNAVQGGIERSTTVRFSCGKRWELIDIKEDSTCHYVMDVTVPELCQHVLFQAPVTKTQVVKCLPVVKE